MDAGRIGDRGTAAAARKARMLPLVAVGLAVLVAGRAHAQSGGGENRFAVVNLTPGAESERVAASVEKEVARIRPGSRPIDDAVMRRLLATGEGPGAAGTRLLGEAAAARADGRCADAIPKAEQAEPLLLGALSFDEERDPLKRLYGLLVVCQHELGNAEKRRAAALRLKNLVSVRPDDFPTELWDQHIANLAPPAAKVELQVDSDPPNGAIQIDLHGVGVTPRTVKVAPGPVYVEVQKEGYKKAFRRVDVGTQPTRTVFRLVERSHDRQDQAEATMNVLIKGKSEVKERPQTLSKLAQLVRAETLAVLSVDGGRARLWFFDAERGAVSGAPIESAYDPATGQMAALAARGGPSAPAAAAPTVGTAAPPPPAPAAREVAPEARPQTVVARPTRRQKSPTPWWGWVIAGAVGGAFALFVFNDRPERETTVSVRARFAPPR